MSIIRTHKASETHLHFPVTWNILSTAETYFSDSKTNVMGFPNCNHTFAELTAILFNQEKSML